MRQGEVSPDFLEMTRWQFQQASKRILSAINPRKDLIESPRALEKKIINHMEETGDRRLVGALRGRFSERVFLEASDDKKLQILLGWVKPKKRRIVRAKPAVSKWLTVGYKRLIREHEQSIIYYRHKLRELGKKLKPYPVARIRRLEEEFLKEIGWHSGSSKAKDYWWKK